MIKLITPFISSQLYLITHHDFSGETQRMTSIVLGISETGALLPGTLQQVHRVHPSIPGQSPYERKGRPVSRD